jgi:hypothetical protein
MKKFFLLLLFSPFLSKIKAQPPKGAKIIFVKGCTYRQAINALINQGIIIEKKDSIDQTILTAFISQKAYSYRLYLRVTDSATLISGQLKLNESFRFLNASSDPNTTYEIQNKGMKGSELRHAWEKMQEFANSLKGDVTYLKE